MKKLAAIFSILLFATMFVKGATVSLAWDGNCDTNVVGYKLYYGGTNAVATTNVIPSYVDDCNVTIPTKTNVYWGTYTNSVAVEGRTNTTCTVSNLVKGFTYSFVVTSRTKEGLESDYSNEAVYTIPTTPPTNTLPTKVENFRVLVVE